MKLTKHRHGKHYTTKTIAERDGGSSIGTGCSYAGDVGTIRVDLGRTREDRTQVDSTWSLELSEAEGEQLAAALADKLETIKRWRSEHIQRAELKR